MDADTWSARARVALGTLVEVRLPATEATERRFDDAFRAIDLVHRRMNAHSHHSDLARIARRAHFNPVRVHRSTFEVLTLARELFLRSQGLFDVTCGPRRRRGGTFDAIELVAPHHVRASHPTALDLGGIAKGYAVDRAIEALRASGTTRGIVNAGGDLRVFGATWMPFFVRDPRDPSARIELGALRDCAIATSADYFRDRSRVLSHRASRLATSFDASLSVIAESCALADALTKPVALDRRAAPALLARYRASAVVIDADHGVLSFLTAGIPNVQSLRFAA